MNYIHFYPDIWYNNLILQRKRQNWQSWYNNLIQEKEQPDGRTLHENGNAGDDERSEPAKSGRWNEGAVMDLNKMSGDGIDSWQEVTLVYNAALRQIETKMEILNDEFQHVHQYNPIEHIKSRIKTPESIVKKLKRHGYESTIGNMVKHVNDIAGIRVICSFTSDIYRIADMIGDQKDIRVIAVKDYITYPKASGYKSYHMIVTVPVYLSDRIVDTKVEIQIRTVAMDFWASLEHKIHYKFEGDAPEHIRNELVECARMVSDLDARMLSLNEEILTLSTDENNNGNMYEA